MKYLLLVILTMTFVMQASAQMGLVFSQPITVAPSNPYDNIRPQITLAHGDIPLVLWGSTIGGRRGFVSRWNGLGFDTPMSISPSGSINTYTVEGPNIEARGDTAYLVYSTYPVSGTKVMLRRSTDGGQNWDLPVWVDSLSGDFATFPDVSITSGGNPIVMYMRQEASWVNQKYVVRKSGDGGQTWEAEVESGDSVPAATVCECCTGRVYASGNQVATVFRRNNANIRDMWATVSSDGGQTFPLAVDLDSTNWRIMACPSSGPTSYIFGDSIYTAFMSGGITGLTRVWLTSTNMTTGQFGVHELIDSTVASTMTQNHPAIAGNADTMAVVWWTLDGSTPEVQLRYTFGGAAGLWNQAVVAVTDSIAGSQNFPDIAYANGVFHIVWANNTTNTVQYCTATVAPISQLEPEVQAIEWQVFPNPGNGPLTVSYPADMAPKLKIRLHDGQGRLIFEQKANLTGKSRLDIEDLPSGIYHLRLMYREAFVSSKIISRL